MNSFSSFELLASLNETLKEKNLTKPTEIQNLAIPLLMDGKSVVGVAETGSGKTLAYALPLLHLLKTLEASKDPVRIKSKPRAVIVVPTRELGEQVSKVFKTFTHGTRLRVRPALGGMEFVQARRNVEGIFEVLLATPGRLVQLMERSLIDLTDVRMLIFDEADQMLDHSFLRDSNLIVAACSNGIQMGLFSATVSPSVQELMNTLFTDAQVLRTKGSGKVVSSLVTKNLTVIDGKRWPLMEEVLAQPVKGGTMIFANTREQCDNLVKALGEKGFACVTYRGEMDKIERRNNLKNFRDGKIQILVSTDLAGRGLDLENIVRVINYHLPKQVENYLHRVGRTARAGRSGLVVNLVTERDADLMAKLDGTYVPHADRPKPKEKEIERPQGFSKPRSGARPHSKTKFAQRPRGKSRF